MTKKYGETFKDIYFFYFVGTDRGSDSMVIGITYHY
jgi:hypothetical protein